MGVSGMTSREYQLHIYSAGAVAPPLERAVDLFKKNYGVNCRLVPGKPEALLRSVAVTKEGDLFCTGAEYFLDDAEEQGLVIRGMRRSLGLRRSVIIVPAGNPAKITSVEDLARDGVKIGIAVEGCLKGVWDDVASKAGIVDAVRKNIVRHADACGTLMGLIHAGEVDAVFGWNAFKNIWPETCDAIELPPDLQVFRSTAIGILSCTKNLELSQKFIDFLVSDPVRRIYSEYGWITG
jgi:accessory colonization factor AcfC